MSKEILNHYLDVHGEWRRGQPEYLESAKSVVLRGVDLRLYETSRSGMALLCPVGERGPVCDQPEPALLASYGDAEVYLKIIYAGGKSEFSSAPLATTVELSKVQELRLNILYLVGSSACERVLYRAMSTLIASMSAYESAGARQAHSEKRRPFCAQSRCRTATRRHHGLRPADGQPGIALCAER